MTLPAGCCKLSAVVHDGPLRGTKAMDVTAPSPIRRLTATMQRWRRTFRFKFANQVLRHVRPICGTGGRAGHFQAL